MRCHPLSRLARRETGLDPHFLDGATGEVAKLGIAEMRLLLSGDQAGGSLAAAEFRGSPGAWTLPHAHMNLEEFFYVVEGTFQFTCGNQEIDATPGSFLMVPRRTPHVFSAVTEGKMLVLWSPGGLEQMFLELGRLPAESITNPAVRAEIGKRYDSVPQ
jgi:mannose-6-phosphate isomerase-like protein (cupin superfamily)